MQVSISIQNNIIQEDLFVLVMSGANIVLGIQWMEQLRPVITNHKELIMEFSLGDKKILF